MEKFKSPMLATDYDERKLDFPRFASVKLDGWRAVIHEGRVKTRSGKEVRNRYVQDLFGKPILEGLDGELIVGAWNQQDTFNRTDSALKKADGEPDVRFMVFDHYGHPEDDYPWRREEARKQVVAFRETFGPFVEMLDHTIIGTLSDLDAFEGDALAAGFEGVMLRPCGSGKYKYGRSTVNEGLLLKVKRFSHDEARIIGYVELMHNGNEAFKDELGRTARTSHKEFKIPSGHIGAYICKAPKWGDQPFRVSCGSMTMAERKERFRLFNFDLGRTIRFKHLSHGAVDLPRHGVFDGFRAEEDAESLA